MRFFDVFPLVSFLVLGLIITLQITYLKKQGVPINSNIKKSVFTKYILYPIFMLVFIFSIFELIKPTLHIPLTILPDIVSKIIIESKIIQISGVLLITVSLFLMLLTLRSFKSSLRFGMDPNNLGKLKTNGIFSFSRNPFFISIELFFVGTVLIRPNLFWIVITSLTLVSIHFFILKEERFLVQNYGEEYLNYSKKVRRYFYF